MKVKKKKCVNFLHRNVKLQNLQKKLRENAVKQLKEQLAIASERDKKSILEKLEELQANLYEIEKQMKYINLNLKREVGMEIKKIDYMFSVCKVKNFSMVNMENEYCFIGKTDEEKSLVCIEENVPNNVIEQDNGWKAFRIQGVLDFSLIGILSKISTLLTENNIGIFAISTYNTDYILTKEDNYSKALEVLSNAGYQII